MIIEYIPAIIALLVAYSPTPALCKEYHLKKICNYSFTTDLEFDHLPEGEECTLNYLSSGSFFSSYITSDRKILSGTGHFGNFEIVNGNPKLTIESYRDEARDVKQEVISSKIVNIKIPIRSETYVSIINVTYTKPTDNSEFLEDTEETYECWNSIVYGNKSAVLVSLCDKKSDSPNHLSWQEKLIKSISVE